MRRRSGPPPQLQWLPVVRALLCSLCSFFFSTTATAGVSGSSPPPSTSSTMRGEQLSLMRSEPLMNNLEGKYGYRAHPHELHCAGGGPISPRT